MGRGRRRKKEEGGGKEGEEKKRGRGRRGGGGRGGGGRGEGKAPQGQLQGQPEAPCACQCSTVGSPRSRGPRDTGFISLPGRSPQVTAPAKPMVKPQGLQCLPGLLQGQGAAGFGHFSLPGLVETLTGVGWGGVGCGGGAVPAIGRDRTTGQEPVRRITELTARPRAPVGSSNSLLRPHHDPRPPEVTLLP